MTDFASIGIQLDSRPVAEGTKALDALSEASVRVEQRVRATNGQMADTAKIMAAQAEQSKASAAANMALGGSTTQLTLGQQQLIEKYREQAAVIGMSRSQLMAYQAAQMGVTAETEKAIAIVKAHEDAVKAATKAKDDEARASGQLSSALKLLAAGYAALKIGEYIKESALLQARYETLGVVLEVVGRNAGYTKTQMDAAADGIARQGITMVESRNSAVKLVQAHVDLANATQLARIAQDAAVIGNINSSEAFDRLVNGISRGNVLILRNIGINVNLQSAYEQMAQSLGKGTKELTENERVQARLNAVIERGTDIAGTYEAAMGTAGKQLLSMQRYVEDLKVKVGEAFNETLTVAVMAFTDHLKDANGEVSDLAKNGQLKEWGHDLAAVMVGVANAIDNVVTGAKMAGTWAAHFSASGNIDTEYSRKLSDAPKDKQAEIRRQWSQALTQEQAQYEAAQTELGARADRFQRAFDDRTAAQLQKHKADADAKLKVDQEYSAKAMALATENAGKSIATQQAAQIALYKSVYVGTPNFRDTEGREAKPKVDQAESARLADHLKRIETEVAAEKAGAEYMMRIDEMRHKAGEMGDETFYQRRRGYAQEVVGAEIEGYTKQLAEMRKHHNNTEAEAEKNAKAIHDIEDKQKAAKDKFGYDELTRDEEDRLRQKAIVSASDDAANKYISSLNAQIAAIELANGKREKSASAIADESAAMFRLAAANMAAQVAAPVGGDHTQADVDAAKAMLITLNQQADAQERIAKALRDGEAASASRKLADMAIQDWQRAGASISDSLSKAFGSGGKALGDMFKAYADNSARQLQLNKEMALAKAKLDTDPTKLKEIDSIQRQSSQAQLKSYGDMADAAQGFFDQGSKGYQAMHAASQVLHAAEVALSLVKGVNAVLTQGEGDPYTAFARMAAMSAVVVGLGVALSGGGGGGGQSAADVQKTQGTGSVFGDSSAKSDSIARSIALAAANSSIELTHTAGMLTALQSIQASMTGLANLVVRTPGMTDASNLNIQTGVLSKTDGLGAKVVGAQVGSMIGGAVAGPIGMWIGAALGGLVSSLWGKTTQNVVDNGFQFGGNVRSLEAGQGFNQYASVDTTKSSWFGLSKSTSNSVQTQGISNDLSSQFGMVFTNLEASLKESAKGLGLSADQVGRTLDNLTLNTQKISLKGLTGDALTSAINGVMSNAMDQMAEAALPGYDKFRKVGEGYAETVTRISTDFQNVGSIFDAMGKPLATTATLSVDARERLIELAGGIDKMASQANSFSSNFLSKAEQLAPVTKYVADQMAALGFAGVNTREQFKSLVLGLDVSTQKGAAQYTALMSLADAFAKTHEATIDLTKSTQEVADERKGLQDQLDQITMTQTQLLTKQRNALDAANRPLFDMVQAAQKLAATSGDMAKFRDAARSLHDGLLTGSLSTLTPEQQYAELRRQYEQTKAAAMAGDTTAQGNFANALTAFETFSQKINGGDSQYAADYSMGLKDSADAATWAQGQVDSAQAQLAAMNSANAILTTIAQGIDNLPTALVNTPINPANYGGADGMPVLVAQVKEMTSTIVALKAEVAGLRADQNKQTGSTIVANDQSNQANADAIVTGVAGAIGRVVNGAQKLALE